MAHSKKLLSHFKMFIYSLFLWQQRAIYNNNITGSDINIVSRIGVKPEMCVFSNYFKISIWTFGRFFLLWYASPLLFEL